MANLRYSESSFKIWSDTNEKVIFAAKDATKYSALERSFFLKI